MIDGHGFDAEQPRAAAIGREQSFVDLDGEQPHLDRITGVWHDALRKVCERLVRAGGILAVVTHHFDDMLCATFIEHGFASWLLALRSHLVAIAVGAPDGH